MTDELASFRRRAIHAEGRVRELENALAAAEARAAGEPAPMNRAPERVGVGASAHDADQLDALARENATLRQRLDGATERTRQLLDRVRFLRQQQEQEAGR
jgi:predicted  nucleic acid-binding Zn-ribbon protein